VRDGAAASEWIFQLVAAAVTLAGIYVAYRIYLLRPELHVQLKAKASAVHGLWFAGWGFDALYDAVFVRPFVWLAKINRHDFIDGFYGALASLSMAVNRIFSLAHNGVMRW